MTMQAITPQQLIERLPPLKEHIGQRYLVKYGGAAMERSEVREAVCLEVALLANLGVKIVVVHGGGKEISRLLERLRIESHFIEGVRVTSPEAMYATEMVLSGVVNKQLASMITLRGAPALGISGRDAHIVEAIPFVNESNEDFGETGDISSCNPGPIEKLLEANLVPVISPVGESAGGAPRNLNADYTAAALAGAIAAKKAIFLTDVDGVRENGTVQQSLSAAKIKELIAAGVISGGMIPKVECALRAIDSGCSEAVICNAAASLIVSRAILGDLGAGTVVTGSNKGVSAQRARTRGTQ